MENLWFELLAVTLLILANGFFAGAELAIVSARRSRIAQLAATGDKRAHLVEQLQSDPHRFLATVQIGVTLVGTTASAIGGVTAVRELKPFFQQIPMVGSSNTAETLALVTVVGLISYLSLIFGELVPKALAIEYAERIALGVARPILFFSVLGKIAVSFLTFSSRTVLAMLSVKREGERAFVTREEIRQLVAEGLESGAVTIGEQELIHNIFNFTQTQVRTVMVPRPRITGIDTHLPCQDILRRVLDHHFTCYPVYQDEIENVIGFVHAKDILAQAVLNPEFSLDGLVRPAFFVPETKKIDELLGEMQHRRLHLALVVDEYGVLSGLVTTEDLLEELVGEIEDDHDSGHPRSIKRLGDESYLVDALLSLHDLEEQIGIVFPGDLPCDTLAGLILHLLGHIPGADEQVVWRDYLFTCIEVTPTSIRRVKIEKRSI